jgi:hypothetical protein
MAGLTLTLDPAAHPLRGAYPDPREATTIQDPGTCKTLRPSLLSSTDHPAYCIISDDSIIHGVSVKGCSGY